jgi:hypothetical protein
MKMVNSYVNQVTNNQVLVTIISCSRYISGVARQKTWLYEKVK